MANRPTDHRNLDLTQLNLDVVRGEAGGKVIWQPRIGAWYNDKMFEGEPLPEPYRGMSRVELFQELGCSNRLYEFNACFVSHEDESVDRATNELGNDKYEVVVDTPVGSQRSVYRRSPNTTWRLPEKWPISDPDDMKVAIWREERRTWEWDQEKYEELLDTWHGLGAPTMYICRTSIQKLFVEDMGPQAGILALVDYPDLCKAYFDALEITQNRLVDVINQSPIEIINYGDNVHAGTCTPKLFEECVLPVYQRRTERLHEGGKFVHAHWDGDCGPLLIYAQETGLDGIEAITPKPQGDVTLEETKEALGDMFLIDGIPAVYFDETYPAEVLVDCARKCIDLFAPNLVLGISDEISSTGKIDRVKLVGEVVDDYNASL
ncbi:MAG: hypothetical protein ACLFWL_09200 [Candidatus Brocadiia bacterium]